MNIFVGSLSFKTTEQDLQKEFEAFGDVDSVKIIVDHATLKSRGFAFVSMPNQDQAQAAINALNGKQVQGFALKVNEAKPREPRSQNRERSEGGYGNSSRPSGGYGNSSHGGGAGGYGNSSRPSGGYGNSSRPAGGGGYGGAGRDRDNNIYDSRGNSIYDSKGGRSGGFDRKGRGGGRGRGGSDSRPGGGGGRRSY